MEHKYSILLILLALSSLFCTISYAGIAGLSKFLRSKYKHAWTKDDSSFYSSSSHTTHHQIKPLEIDHVCIDMNQILHGSFRSTKNPDHVLAKIFLLLDKILRFNKPRKSLVLAFDGPAPFAKLQTQRNRRRSHPENGLITPGTDFMNSMENMMLCYVLQRIKWPIFRNVSVFISDGTYPGEGELKIINWIRNHMPRSNNTSMQDTNITNQHQQHYQQQYPQNADNSRFAHNFDMSSDSLLIVGSDSDIIVQSLCVASICPNTLVLQLSSIDGIDAMCNISILLKEIMIATNVNWNDMITYYYNQTSNSYLLHNLSSYMHSFSNESMATSQNNQLVALNNKNDFQSNIDNKKLLSKSLKTASYQQFKSVHLDLVVLFALQGNDYLPKLKGISLSRALHSYGKTMNKLPFEDRYFIDLEKQSFNFHALWLFMKILSESSTSSSGMMEENSSNNNKEGENIVSLPVLIPTAVHYLNTILQQKLAQGVSKSNGNKTKKHNLYSNSNINSYGLVWYEEQVVINKENKAMFVDYFSSNFHEDMELINYLEDTDSNKDGDLEGNNIDIDNEEDEDIIQKPYEEEIENNIQSNHINSVDTTATSSNSNNNNSNNNSNNNNNNNSINIGNYNVSVLWKVTLMYKKTNYTTDKYYISKKIARQATAEKLIRIISEEGYSNYTRSKALVKDALQQMRIDANNEAIHRLQEKETNRVAISKNKSMKTSQYYTKFVSDINKHSKDRLKSTDSILESTAALTEFETNEIKDKDYIEYLKDSDIETYLNGLLWIASMYTNGNCSDLSYTYNGRPPITSYAIMMYIERAVDQISRISIMTPSTNVNNKTQSTTSVLSINNTMISSNNSLLEQFLSDSIRITSTWSNDQLEKELAKRIKVPIKDAKPLSAEATCLCVIPEEAYKYLPLHLRPAWTWMRSNFYSQLQSGSLSLTSYETLTDTLEKCLQYQSFSNKLDNNIIINNKSKSAIINPQDNSNNNNNSTTTTNNTVYEDNIDYESKVLNYRRLKTDMKSNRRQKKKEMARLKTLKAWTKLAYIPNEINMNENDINIIEDIEIITHHANNNTNIISNNIQYKPQKFTSVYPENNNSWIIISSFPVLKDRGYQGKYIPAVIKLPLPVNFHTPRTLPYGYFIRKAVETNEITYVDKEIDFYKTNNKTNIYTQSNTINKNNSKSMRHKSRTKHRNKSIKKDLIQ